MSSRDRTDAQECFPTLIVLTSWAFGGNVGILNGNVSSGPQPAGLHGPEAAEGRGHPRGECWWAASLSLGQPLQLAWPFPALLRSPAPHLPSQRLDTQTSWALPVARRPVPSAEVPRPCGQSGSSIEDTG